MHAPQRPPPSTHPQQPPPQLPPPQPPPPLQPQPPRPPPPPPRPTLEICRVDIHPSQPSLQSWLLTQPAPFVAALDFPFGQPRQLAEVMGWHAGGWRGLLESAAALSREAFEAALRGFMAGQPPGHKHLRRRVAAFSREVSPMSLVRTPTAKMFHAGVGLLAAAADAGCHVAPHMPREALGAGAGSDGVGVSGGGGQVLEQRDVAVAAPPRSPLAAAGAAGSAAPTSGGAASDAAAAADAAEAEAEAEAANAEADAARSSPAAPCGSSEEALGAGGRRCCDGSGGRLRVLLEAYPALPARRVLAGSLGVGAGAKCGSEECGGSRGGAAASRPRAGPGSGPSPGSGSGSGSVGRVCSYKSDSRGKAADPGRTAARVAICRALIGTDSLTSSTGAAATGEDEEEEEEVGRGGAVGGDTAARDATALDGRVEPPGGATRRRRRRQLRRVGADRPTDGSDDQASPPPAGPALLPCSGRVVGLSEAYGLAGVVVAPEVLRQCEEDASGDTLDAVLAALQAAWAATRGPEGNWGAPEDVDPLEGWVTDPWVWEQHLLALRNAEATAASPRVHHRDDDDDDDDCRGGFGAVDGGGEDAAGGAAATSGSEVAVAAVGGAGRGGPVGLEEAEALGAGVSGGGGKRRRTAEGGSRQGA
ncbi:hypothetical protein PLESTM_000596700 [Pleodorina starrii]|nr:hypothetical protein PLESTM_000596700 [Pleodorina starrii]